MFTKRVRKHAHLLWFQLLTPVRDPLSCHIFQLLETALLKDAQGFFRKWAISCSSRYSFLLLAVLLKENSVGSERKEKKEKKTPKPNETVHHNSIPVMFTIFSPWKWKYILSCSVLLSSFLCHLSHYAYIA